MTRWSAEQVDQEAAFLHRCLADPLKQHIRDIAYRRLYCIEYDIPYANPLNNVDEVLYQLWKQETGPIEPPAVPKTAYELELDRRYGASTSPVWQGQGYQAGS